MTINSALGMTKAKMTALTKTASETGSPRFLQNRYSVRNPNRQETATTARDRQPKK
jgi:hypothetical protein